MTIAVQIIGGMIALSGVFGIVHPDSLRRMGNLFLHAGWEYAAVGIRLVLGTFLVVAGPYCRPETPEVGLIVRVIGVLLIIAAIALLVVGRERIRQLIAWGVSRPSWFLRTAALMSVALGSFLIYAGN